MGYLAGYMNNDIACKHGKCGYEKNVPYWDYKGTRYYFRTGSARGWYARATVEGTVTTLHEYSQPIGMKPIPTISKKPLSRKLMI